MQKTWVPIPATGDYQRLLICLFLRTSQQVLL